MDFDFEWDEEKARSNIERHDISFAEAATVFVDPLSVSVSDAYHSFDEDRFIIVGESEQGRLLVVTYMERGDSIRIISARKANRREKRDYERNA